MRDIVRVRDRLMHPKKADDLEVTDAEIESTRKALDWFFISYGICSCYVQKAH